MNAFKSFSFENQDEFVNLLFDKDGGSFLDIACGHPTKGSNTYSLESRGWMGIGFDIENCELNGWSKIRKSPFFQLDATSENLAKSLRDNLKDKLVDYLSLDVDVGGCWMEKNLSPAVLPRILDAGVSFKCATIEHESFKYGPSGRDYMRSLLLEKGYVMLFEDVSFHSGSPFEDWWINPLFFSDDILSIKNKSINYEQAVSFVKKFNSPTI